MHRENVVVANRYDHDEVYLEPLRQSAELGIGLFRQVARGETLGKLSIRRQDGREDCVRFEPRYPFGRKLSADAKRVIIFSSVHDGARRLECSHQCRRRGLQHRDFIGRDAKLVHDLGQKRALPRMVRHLPGALALSSQRAFEPGRLAAFADEGDTEPTGKKTQNCRGRCLEAVCPKDPSAEGGAAKDRESGCAAGSSFHGIRNGFEKSIDLDGA